MPALEKLLSTNWIAHLPLRVNGYVVSNASDRCALFVLGKETADIVAELLRKDSKRPDWVTVQAASFTKTSIHSGWFRDIPLPDTGELLIENRSREDKLAVICRGLKQGLEYAQTANDTFIETAASDPWRHIAEIQEKIEQALNRAEEIAGQ